jgi:hypothetical protein
MPGPSLSPCTFPDDFVHAALETVRRRTVAVQVVQRFRLALLLHVLPDTKNDDAAKKVSWSARLVRPPATSRSKTTPAASARPFFPPLDRPLIQAMAC